MLHRKRRLTLLPFFFLFSTGGTRPPAKVPSPTPSPVSHLTTPSPTPANSVSIGLSAFEVVYTVGDNTLPQRQQYDELTALTNAYLDAYMKERFQSQTQATLVALVTERKTGRWVADKPITLVYESTAFFDPVFDALPSQATLDTVLSDAFAQDNIQPYLDGLASLPTSNIFRTTTSVQFGEPTITASTKSGGSTSSNTTNGAAIAAGAVGIALLAAGLVIYKKRRQSEDDNYSYSGKALHKNKNLHGDMTVAGETYAGETYDGSVSFGSGSQLSRDEEQGFVSVDLHSSAEQYDDSSVAPAWDGGSVSEGYETAHGFKEVISDEESESESEEENEEDTAVDMGELDVDGAYEVQSMQVDAKTTTTASASYSRKAAEYEEEDSQEGYEDSTEGDFEGSTHESYSSDLFESRVEQESSSLSFEDTDVMDLSSQRAEDEDASTTAEPSLAEADLESSVDGDAGDASQDTRVSAKRPLSIAEIEYLLSADLEDDRSSRSSRVVSKTSLSTTL